MIEQDELDCKRDGRGWWGQGGLRRGSYSKSRRERRPVQGSEEAEMVLSDGPLRTQSPSLYHPALSLYFSMCRVINLLVMLIVRLPPL